MKNTNKSFSLILGNSNGSALLVTLLLMAILLVLGLGFGRLILDNIRLEYNVVQAGKAYYHAEAGIEEALFFLDRKPPGFEQKDFQGDSNGDGDNDYRYTIKALSSSADQRVPCNFDTTTDEIWKKLSLNETLTLPLFRSGSFGTESVEDFTIEYYLGKWPSGVSDSEILAFRWKILGLLPATGETQAISEYVPVLKSANNAITPTYFGTELRGGVGEIPDGDQAQFRDCSSGTCIFYEQYSISEFLTRHRDNFLVVSNVLSLPDVRPEEETTLYVRLREVSGEPLVCSKVRIEVDGVPQNIQAPQSLNVVQNLNVDIALDEFLPVFNFALYRTKVE